MLQGGHAQPPTFLPMALNVPQVPIHSLLQARLPGRALTPPERSQLGITNEVSAANTWTIHVAKVLNEIQG